MVYFVGAGCGAADLITVRGMRLIQQADVLIYAGSLVNPELLGYADSGCEIHNSAEMTLDDIISVMVQAEEAGKTVVRLHTGEPSIYGAVQEQMRQLEKDKSGVQFSHTAHEQLTGQLKAGLQLLDLYEDTNGYGNLHAHNIPTYWATLARKA